MSKKSIAKSISLDNGTANDKNSKIVNEFEKLIKQIKYEIDHSPSTSESMTNYYRLRQVSGVLDAIKKYPNEIKSGSDLKNIKGIGSHSIQRIDEIIKSGKLSEIKTTTQSKKYSDAVDELKEVIGIGPRSAYDFVTKLGIKNVADLKKKYNDGTIELNHQQQLGIKYYNVVKKNIPRNEIDQIYNYVSSISSKVDRDIFIVVCGSYRRQKMTSGDVDLLITHPKNKTKDDLTNKQNYLIALVNSLKKAGFLIDDLTDKDYEMKYMGFCKFESNPVRRIDIRYVPYDSYYTSLLYFTGSDDFNKKMRLLAIHLGYELSEYGLFKVSNNKKIKIKINSEKDVFDVLGMEFLTPDKRT